MQLYSVRSFRAMMMGLVRDTYDHLLNEAHCLVGTHRSSTAINISFAIMTDRYESGGKRAIGLNNTHLHVEMMRKIVWNNKNHHQRQQQRNTE